MSAFAGSFNDSWISEKLALEYYKRPGSSSATVRIEIMRERASSTGKPMADFVVICNVTGVEQFRHTRLTIQGKFGPYNVLTRVRERFVPGGDPVKERCEF